MDGKHVVVMGAGIGGLPMAYELKELLRPQDKLTVVGLGERMQAPLMEQLTSDAEAYELYRRGRYLWNTRTREGHERAIEYYRRAIERDSGFAAAYAGLADAYITAYQLNVTSLALAGSGRTSPHQSERPPLLRRTMSHSPAIEASVWT